MPELTVRIGIDCRLLGPAHAGIGRYIEQLVTHLIRQSMPTGDDTITLSRRSRDHAPIGESNNTRHSVPTQSGSGSSTDSRHSGLACPEVSGDPKSQNRNATLQPTWVLFYSDQQQLQILKRICPTAEFRHTPIRHYSLAEQIKLPATFNQAKLDLLHVPHFNVPLLYRRPFVVTIHDLLWHEYRGSHVTTLSPARYWIKYLFYRLVSNHAMTRSKAILVPSQAVANTILNILPTVKSKIQVTPESTSLNLFATQVDNLPKKYWLYVGSLYPHKNVKLVFQALQLLPQVYLVIISTRSVFADQMQALAKELQVASQIRWLWGISDSRLKSVYQKATVLIQPSLSEGFGLTGLEAMSVGCPVVCSDIPVFKEVYGQAATYFHPQQPQSLLTAIDTISKSPAKWQTLGRQHAQRFSWQKTAKLTWEVYQKALGDCPMF